MTGKIDPLSFETFRSEFEDAVRTEGLDWEIRGLLLKNDKIHTFGSDTKVLSTIFEMFCAPIVQAIAFHHGYGVLSALQTIYPDFTLASAEDSKDKIAIDVKTTYRRGLGPFRYTLGSYTSFLRNGTKNILYPYDQYSHHWVIGFLYSRRLVAPDTERVFDYDRRGEIMAPYENVEWFVQEKYKIVGESPASGNTTNIGSFPTANIEDLRQGRGPFAEAGKEACDAYWRNFDRVRATRTYRTLREYLIQFGT